MAMGSTSGATPRGDALCLVGLAAIWAAITLLVNPVGDFPLNDDWVYGLAVKSILETGDFRLPSSATVNVMAQAYWGALFCLPFGFSFTALRVSTLVAGLIGVWLTYGVLRQVGANSESAFLGAVLIAVNPLYVVMANSFMTDVPFYALCAASLFFLIRWSLHANGRSAGAGLFVAYLSILIRQAGIVFPFGFAAAYAWRNRATVRSIGLGILVVAVGLMLHFGYQTWLQQTERTPDLWSASGILDTVIRNSMKHRGVLKPIFAVCAYVGLFLLPFLLYMYRRRWLEATHGRRALLGAIAVFMAIVAVGGLSAFGKSMPLADNVLVEYGFGPLTLRDTYLLATNLPDIPSWLSYFWYAATALAVVGVALLISLIVHEIVQAFFPRDHLRGLDELVILVGCCGAAYLALITLAVGHLFDRYILFLMLAAITFVALSRSRRSIRAGPIESTILVLLVLTQAIFAILGTRDYLEWNRNRWRATAELMQAGISPTSIDGGYEFNGWYVFDPTYKASEGKSYWWVVDDEYMIASGAVANYSPIRSYPFRRLLTGEHAQVVVLRRDR
jgi:hypothetical protein